MGRAEETDIRRPQPVERQEFRDTGPRPIVVVICKRDHDDQPLPKDAKGHDLDLGTVRHADYEDGLRSCERQRDRAFREHDAVR